MAEPSYNDDLLIRYLDGELTSEEKVALEGRLLTDVDLKESLTRLQTAVQAVRQFGTAEAVKDVHAEMMKELKTQRPAKAVPFGKAVRYLMAAAACAAALFIGIRLYQSWQLSPDKLYAEAFVDFSVSTSRSAGGGLSEIEKRYQQGHYEAVTDAVRTLRLDAEDSLLVALAYLHRSRTAQAIGIFQTLASSPNNFQQDAEFYLSLSHLKNKNYGAALPLLKKIASTPLHLYHERINEDFVEKVEKLNRR